MARPACRVLTPGRFLLRSYHLPCTCTLTPWLITNHPLQHVPNPARKPQSLTGLTLPYGNPQACLCIWLEPIHYVCMSLCAGLTYAPPVGDASIPAAPPASRQLSPKRECRFLLISPKFDPPLCKTIRRMQALIAKTRPSLTAWGQSHDRQSIGT